MKLIIDIPDNTYADIQEHKRYTDFTILDLIKAIRHSTPIPDNATDGDVIMAIFPTVDTYFSNVIDMRLWWNAKYKGAGEIHCNHTDAEIAKSFIKDVEAVKDLLPRGENEDK